MVDNDDTYDGEDSFDPGTEDGYDPDLMGDLGSKEDYEHAPKWKKLRLQKMRKKILAAENEASRLKGYNEQLEKRLLALEGRMNGSQQAEEKPEPQGWDAFKTQDLKKWLSDAEVARNSAIANPDDAEARQRALSINPEYVVAVQEELARRTAREATGQLRSEWEEQRQTAMRGMQMQQKIVRDFGNDVLDPRSELMQTAATELRALQEEFGVEQDPTGVMTYKALENAQAKLNGHNRGGRGLSEADRRRLAVEAQTRREAGVSNSIAALRQRGDWRSRDKAVDLELDQFLNRITGGR